jgi:hypothetical protein
MTNITCPKCGQTRQLKNASARRAAQRGSVCRTCHSRRAGKAGYAATVDKYGIDFFLECTARVQRQKPSQAEERLAAMLDEFGVEYTRQQKLRTPARGFVLDFVLSNGVLIEVNGYWHKRNGTLRDTELARNWQKRTLFIDADELVKCPQAIREVLADAIYSN